MASISDANDAFGTCPYWHGEVNSEKTDQVLDGEPRGSFIIRYSNTSKAPIISWVSKKGVKHAIVQFDPDSGMLYLDSPDKSYKSITELLAAHEKTLKVGVTATPRATDEHDEPLPPLPHNSRRNKRAKDERDERKRHGKEKGRASGARRRSAGGGGGAPRNPRLSALMGTESEVSTSTTSTSSVPSELPHVPDSAHVADDDHDSPSPASETPPPPRPPSVPAPSATSAAGDAAAAASALAKEFTSAGLNFRNVSRVEAEDLLLRAPVGSYLVRPSSKGDCMALTYVGELRPGQGQIGHLLLSRTPAGWATEGRPEPIADTRALLLSLPYNLLLEPAPTPAAALAAGGEVDGGGGVTLCEQCASRPIEARVKSDLVDNRTLLLCRPCALELAKSSTTVREK